ncbi:MAG: hypothetical protein AAB209_10225, partial [Bacteroidota bacterium]
IVYCLAASIFDDAALKRLLNFIVVFLLVVRTPRQVGAPTLFFLLLLTHASTAFASQSAIDTPQSEIVLRSLTSETLRGKPLRV